MRAKSVNHRKGLAVLSSLMIVCCVPKSEHEGLRGEFNALEEVKNQLQGKVDQLTAAIGQQQKENQALIDAAVKEARSEAEGQIREKEDEILKVQGELEMLKKEFEKFKEVRRTGMVDRKYPTLVVKNLRMTDAVIKNVSASTVKFAHSGGISSVRLADLGSDMQWEAVWTAEEAEQHEKYVTANNAKAAQASQAANTANEIMLAIKDKGQSERRAEELRKLVPNLTQLIDARRQDLNDAFERLARQYSRLAEAGNSNDWNREAPEASPLLVDWQKRPAMQGLRELDALASGIKAIQKQGSAAVDELSRLEKSLDSTR